MFAGARVMRASAGADGNGGCSAVVARRKSRGKLSSVGQELKIRGQENECEYEWDSG